MRNQSALVGAHSHEQRRVGYDLFLGNFKSLLLLQDVPNKIAVLIVFACQTPAGQSMCQRGPRSLTLGSVHETVRSASYSGLGYLQNTAAVNFAGMIPPVPIVAWLA